jgi:hypothetical protein
MISVKTCEFTCEIECLGCVSDVYRNVRCVSLALFLVRSSRPYICRLLKAVALGSKKTGQYTKWTDTYPCSAVSLRTHVCILHVCRRRADNQLDYGLLLLVGATGPDRYIDRPCAALFLYIRQLARHTTPFRMSDRSCKEIYRQRGREKNLGKVKQIKTGLKESAIEKKK